MFENVLILLIHMVTKVVSPVPVNLFGPLSQIQNQNIKICVSYNFTSGCFKGMYTIHSSITVY